MCLFLNLFLVFLASDLWDVETSFVEVAVCISKALWSFPGIEMADPSAITLDLLCLPFFFFFPLVGHSARKWDFCCLLCGMSCHLLLLISHSVIILSTVACDFR